MTVRAELSAVVPGPGPRAAGAPVEYAVAVDHYLAQACLSPASRRVYRISLTSWAWPLVGRAAPPGSRRRGARPPVVPLALLGAGDAPAKLAAAVARRARHADARTVNREVSALRGAVGWWLDLHWIDRDPTTGLRYQTGGPAALPALSDRQVAEVFRLPAGLREQALWRVLHDCGSPVDEVLALDAGSVDVAGLIQLRPETSEILGWLLAGRPCGPLFLTDRRAPARAPAGDVCPVTGRARMSYRRAAEIFADRTRPLDPAGRGWTLHQLRPVPRPVVSRSYR